MDKNLWFAGKDINYLAREDLKAYRVLYPPVPVRFLDHSKTVVDNFKTQPVIALRDPIPVNLHITFQDLKKIMDRFKLREIPDGACLFSIAILNELRLPAEAITVEPDVRFDFDGVNWRIAQVWPETFIGNNEAHLHWLCTIERSSRHSYIQEDQVFYKDYNLYYIAGTALTPDQLLRSDLTTSNKDTVNIQVTTEGSLYLFYNSTFGDLQSVIKDGTDILSSFTKTTVTVNGSTYNQYSADATTYANTVISLQVNLNPHYK